MNICISTVKRPNNSPYLDRLIESIRKEYHGTIHLVIGGKDVAYTRKYHDGYIKHFLDEDKYPTNIQKAGFGYFTALTLNRDESLLILEDDALLAPGWYKDLQERVSFIPAGKYVLSLITPTGSLLPEPDSTVPSVQRFKYKAVLEYKDKGQLPITHIITYSNTTGIYYSAEMLQTRLPEFIFKFAVNGTTVYDLVLGNYMFRYDLPIYIAVPNLLLDTDVLDSHLGEPKPKSDENYVDWDYNYL